MIYFIQEIGLFRSRVKIGFTDDLKSRMRQIRTSSPSRIKLLLALEGDQGTEFIYHQKFTSCRLHGEWFKYGLKLKLFVWFNWLKSQLSPLPEAIENEASQEPITIFGLLPPPKPKLKGITLLRASNDQILELHDQGLYPSEISKQIVGWTKQEAIDYINSVICQQGVDA